MSTCKSPQAARGNLNVTCGPTNTTSGHPCRGESASIWTIWSAPDWTRVSWKVNPETPLKRTHPRLRHNRPRPRRRHQRRPRFMAAQGRRRACCRRRAWPVLRDLKQNRSALKHGASPVTALPRAAGNSKHGPPGDRPPVGTSPTSRKTGKFRDVTTPLSRITPPPPPDSAARQPLKSQSPPHHPAVPAQRPTAYPS